MSDFQYSYRAYDLPESKQESNDLLDARDKQLEYYLKQEKASIASINSTLAFKADSRNWISWLPSLRRGTTNVTTSTTTATYTSTDNLVIVNCEAQITSAISFPGNQILRFGLPIFANPATRVLGHGMFQWAGVFHHCLAFIEGTAGGLEAVFLPDKGQPWLGQTLAGNPTISGSGTGNNFYMNLTYRFT
jgi:hypothetical protein